MAHDCTLCSVYTVHCTNCTVYILSTVQCPCMHSAHLANKSRFSTVYIVHCIVKWTIFTLYVVQIVQSIIYPCPCTLNKYSLSMYNVHCTFYNVPCVKCKICTHYRLYTLQYIHEKVHNNTVTVK